MNNILVGGTHSIFTSRTDGLLFNTLSIILVNIYNCKQNITSLLGGPAALPVGFAGVPVSFVAPPIGFAALPVGSAALPVVFAAVPVNGLLALLF